MKLSSRKLKSNRFHGNKRAAGSRRPGGERMDRKEMYIEKYCKDHGVSSEEAKTHATVKAAMEYYDHIEDGKIAVSEVKAGCGGAEIGADCK